MLAFIANRIRSLRYDVVEVNDSTNADGTGKVISTIPVKESSKCKVCLTFVCYFVFAVGLLLLLILSIVLLAKNEQTTSLDSSEDATPGSEIKFLTYNDENQMILNIYGFPNSQEYYLFDETLRMFKRGYFSTFQNHSEGMLLQNVVPGKKTLSG